MNTHQKIIEDVRSGHVCVECLKELVDKFRKENVVLDTHGNEITIAILQDEMIKNNTMLLPACMEVF